MKRIVYLVSFLFANVCANATDYSFGQDALIKAVEDNDLSLSQNLLQKGYNVNYYDRNYNTAYCYAYYNGNYKMSRLLEQYGANTNQRCFVNNSIFTTYPSNVVYQQTKVESHSSFWPDFKLSRMGSTPLFVAAGVGGAAMALSGGGGGGSDSSSSSFVKPPVSGDVDPSAFETAEFYGDAAGHGLSEASDSEFLDIINAQYAYARGYNGSGQIIAVLDSGIDTDNSEFAATLYPDLTNTDIQSSDNDPNHDGNGDHGTNVASIAAASKDDTGMHGVAYGAQVIGYRIGINALPGYINAGLTDDAINDGVSKGARVFNLSYGSIANSSSNASLAVKDDLEGAYTGYNDGNDNTNTVYMDTLISNVTSSDSIIVRAAGNDGYSQSAIQSALPLHYTEFDGHFVNVVALNSAGNAIASYSNRCGVTKDYCIAAPGSYVMLATDGGGYDLAQGTSFAAPTVAGAVAVVKDAFGLSADRTLNILFQTATDMGVSGVDDVYGHGLLNLDLATAPGAELITGVSLNNSFAYADTNLITSSAFANLQLPTFVIEDELYRTFKVNGSTLVSAKDEKVDLQERAKTFAKTKKVVKQKSENGLRSSFVMTADQQLNDFKDVDYFSIATDINSIEVEFGFTNSPGQDLDSITQSANLIQENSTANPYLALADQGFITATNYQLNDDWSLQTNVFFGDVEDSDENNLGKSAAALTKLTYAINDDSKISFETGILNEKETILGSKFEGAFALANNSYTYFTGVSGKAMLTENLDIFANAYLGVTKPDTVQKSLITDVSTIISESVNLGANYKLADDKKLGLVLSQPLKVISGDIAYSYLSGGNIDSGYQYTKQSAELSADATEFDIQAFYDQKINNSNLNFGLLHTLNADNIAGQTDTALLVKLTTKF